MLTSFKILRNFSTFTVDYEYYLRQVCARTVIGKDVVRQGQIKRNKKTSFSLLGYFIFAR